MYLQLAYLQLGNDGLIPACCRTAWRAGDSLPAGKSMTAVDAVSLTGLIVSNSITKRATPKLLSSLSLSLSFCLSVCLFLYFLVISYISPLSLFIRLSTFLFLPPPLSSTTNFSLASSLFSPFHHPSPRHRLSISPSFSPSASLSVCLSLSIFSHLIYLLTFSLHSFIYISFSPPSPFLHD